LDQCRPRDNLRRRKDDRRRTLLQTNLGFVLLRSVLESPFWDPFKLDNKYVFKGGLRDLINDNPWPWLDWQDAEPTSPPSNDTES
jgi:hypothetical protein